MRRLNANGSLDSTFGNFGQTVIKINSSYLPFVINPSNGKMIVGGSQNSTPALQHFNANGTYDTAFGTDGIKTVPLSADCGTYTMTPRWFESLVLQSDGNLIAGAGVSTLGGCTEPYCYGNAIVRLNAADDTLDTAYGFGGFAVKCNGRIGAPKLKIVPTGSNQILAKLHTPITGGSSSLRRFQSIGFQNLILEENSFDFLAQQTDGKIVTISKISTGDGRTDLAIWRPSNGNWYILRSESTGFYAFPFGANGDVPIPADYDGDGKTDAGVFRPSNSGWYVMKSNGGTLIQQFGLSGELPTATAFTQ